MDEVVEGKVGRMEKEVFELLLKAREKEELESLIALNERSRQFGLTLTEEAAKELAVCRKASLKFEKRVEFGKGVLESLIDKFCDSQYITQENYVQTLESLQDIFYEFKNESMDLVTDEELLEFMKEQFEEICFGDLEYLETTCLERFAEAVRAGFSDYQSTGGTGVYSSLSQEQRWDKELYLSVLRELFWG